MCAATLSYFGQTCCPNQNHGKETEKWEGWASVAEKKMASQNSMQIDENMMAGRNSWVVLNHCSASVAFDAAAVDDVAVVVDVIDTVAGIAELLEIGICMYR